MNTLRLCIVVIICSLTFTAMGQAGVSALLPDSAKTIESFIPKGWILLDSANGDYDKDNIKDIALVIVDSVLEKEGEVYRSVVVLKGTRYGYSRTAAGDSVILCRGCGGIFGDPFDDIIFNGTVLTITHYGGSAWRWEYTDKFQFRKGKWVLIGETSNSYWNVKHCDKLDDFAGTNYKDTNFITGQFEEKQISENCKLLKNKKGKQKVEPLIALEKFTVVN